MYCGVPAGCDSDKPDARRFRAEDLRDAEVRDLHRARFVEQQVLRLDVAMHDAVLVRVLQRLADRRHDGQRLLRREAARLHRLPQIHAIHELHEQVVKPARLPEIVDRDDVRMIERRERLGLVRETFGKLRIGHPLRREQLQRDQAAQRLLPRLIDHAHPAAPEKLDDFELRKMRRDFLRRRWRERRRPFARQDGVRHKVQRPEALRAQPVHAPLGERRPAARAVGG